MKVQQQHSSRVCSGCMQHVPEEVKKQRRPLTCSPSAEPTLLPSGHMTNVRSLSTQSPAPLWRQNNQNELRHDRVQNNSKTCMRIFSFSEKSLIKTSSFGAWFGLCILFWCDFWGLIHNINTSFVGPDHCKWSTPHLWTVWEVPVVAWTSQLWLPSWQQKVWGILKTIVFLAWPLH